MAKEIISNIFKKNLFIACCFLSTIFNQIKWTRKGPAGSPVPVNHGWFLGIYSLSNVIIIHNKQLYYRKILPILTIWCLLSLFKYKTEKRSWKTRIPNITWILNLNRTRIETLPNIYTIKDNKKHNLKMYKILWIKPELCIYII